MNTTEIKPRGAVVPSEILADEQGLPGLSLRHLKELRASGLNDDTIKAAGIYSETKPETIAVLLGTETKLVKKLVPAIVFPYHNASGQLLYSRIKPDTPRKDHNGKSIKYESPRSQPNRLYLPAGIADKLHDSNCELLITEGEKKALAAWQFGWACIGLVGVFGWKVAKSQKLLPDFEHITWQGRRVTIVFDSDISTKPDIQLAESQLAKHLTESGAIVRVVRLPDGPTDFQGKPSKLGLDDYLLLHGSDELRKLLDSASEPEPLQGDEIKLAASAIDPASEAERFLLQRVVDDRSLWVHYKGDFYRWREGRYQVVPDAEVSSTVTNHLNKFYFKLWPQHTQGVLQQVKAKAMFPSSIDCPAWLGDSIHWPLTEVLATRSQVIHLPSLVTSQEVYMIPATPKLFTTNALEYEFDAVASRPELWLTKLQEWFAGDAEAIETLQEIFGYLLTADTKQQKIFLLVGPPRSGKGTIARVLQSLVGTGNCIGVTFQQLTTTFGMQSFLGKSLAIFNDARHSNRADESIIVERLLSISGEDSLSIDRKFKEPLTSKLPTRLLVISNELPRLRDNSGALASRMIVLQSSVSFADRVDPTLTDRLLTELPGILLWSIAGWDRLRSRGEFKQPENGQELLTELRDLTSPVGEFVRECCQVGPLESVSLDDLFSAWQSWCKDQGQEYPGDKAKFGRDLQAVVSVQVKRANNQGDRYKVYHGIRLLT